jgi:NADH:quinone reductase (non-electrogenic)
VHKHRVVVVGGGFAGLATVRGLRRAAVEVILVDRRNFHLFQPLLYQVATGGLSPADIAVPLRAIVKRQRNASVQLAEAIDIDLALRRVRLADGELPYDTLVVATGASHHYFGHPEWERLAPGLKTIEDATTIRRRVLSAFERAERCADDRERAALLRFLIVGAGPTGVELAGALAEIARDTLAHEFRCIDPATADILLVEGTDRVLPGYPLDLSRRAAASLQRLGVRLRLGSLVTNVEADGVLLQTGDRTDRVGARTVIWAAGVKASPLVEALKSDAGTLLDSAGRVVVAPDLTVPGHPEVLVLGDLANVVGRDGRPSPGVAPVAIQQGSYAARLIRRRLSGRQSPAFRYRDWGTMATIGRHAAVADILGLHLSGYPAWLMWLFIHLMKIVDFENRLLVFVQLAWSYLTFNRAARLITGEPWWSDTDVGQRYASGRPQDLPPSGAQPDDTERCDQDADGHTDDLLPAHAGCRPHAELVGRATHEEHEDTDDQEHTGYDTAPHS